MSPISSFRSIENEHDVYRSKDCMRMFCEILRQHTMKIIVKRKTKEQQESYENTKICYICIEKCENKYLKNKNIVKLESIVIIQKNVEVLLVAHVI